MSKTATAVAAVLMLVFGFLAGRAAVPREQPHARAQPRAQSTDYNPPVGFVRPPQPPPPPDIRRDNGAPDASQTLRVPLGGSPTRGAADALVTLVVFSDYQCPFCARVEDTFASLRRRYGADLRVVWKNEPLAFHDHAMLAAEAAQEALAQRGNAGFWRFHDALFADPQHLERADLEALASTQGLDMARFRSSLDRHAHAAQIAADHALAQRLEANGTPHMFINGRRIVGAQPEAAFAALIDETRHSAQAFITAHPGATRANVYERLMAAAETTVRHGPEAPPAGVADEENRVYSVRDNPGAPSWGPRDARVVIQHFSDFQCPFCARVGPQVEQMRQRYADRVRFVWRDYPLPFHDHAMLAAEAAQEALAQRGNAGFWRFHDALLADQQHLERADLEALASTQGLNMARFRAALDGHVHQARIRDDVAAADATGASIGTPAFFINGRFIAGALPFDEFARRIDAALAAR